jgi:hypothetical protein
MGVASVESLLTHNLHHFDSITNYKHMMNLSEAKHLVATAHAEESSKEGAGPNRALYFGKSAKEVLQAVILRFQLRSLKVAHADRPTISCPQDHLSRAAVRRDREEELQ